MRAKSSFNLFGTPVAVDPIFFAFVLFIGWASGQRSLVLLTAWVAIVFVSILWHEMGHAVAFRAYGHPAAISLVGMGGVTYPVTPKPISPGRDILISLAGPAAGMLLGGAVWALRHFGGIGVYASPDDYEIATIVSELLFVNIGWGLFNLVPMLPLDGGRVMAATLKIATKGEGFAAALVVSLVVGAALAVAAYLVNQPYVALLVLLFGFSNITALQQVRRSKQAGKDSRVVDAREAVPAAAIAADPGPQASIHSEAGRPGPDQPIEPETPDPAPITEAEIVWNASGGDEPRSVQQSPANTPGKPGMLVKAILLINLVIFVAQQADPAIAARFVQNPLAIALGHQWYRLLTPMLLHADFIHIGFNSYALWIYGPVVEETMGKARFLAIYVVAGFTGNVASFTFGQCPSFGLGASGAIFGIIGALLVYHFARRKTSAAGRAGLQGILFIIIINLAIGFSSQGIDNFAHMGGLAGGILVGAGFDRAERLRAAGKVPPSVATAAQVAALFLVAAAGIALAAYKTSHFTCAGL